MLFRSFLQQGVSATVASVTISGFTGGFNYPVSLSASGLPAGLTGKFSAATLSGSGSGAIYSLSVGSSVIPGVYRITVTGVGANIVNTATLSINVTGTLATTKH